MLTYPFLNLFLISLFSSTILALSSSHWLMVWMSLELNMISFLPIISASNSNQEAESAVKYFLFQALGSSLILLSILSSSMSWLTVMGLLLKLGAAPFHFWFPPMVAGLPWLTTILLMTWQKIGPMVMLIPLCSQFSLFIITIGIMSVIVGALGGLSQSSLRPLLAYSSIAHMGWIVASTSISPSLSMMYFFFYLMISVPVLWGALHNNTVSISSPLSAHSPTVLAFLVGPCILSLSGLPPLTGFFPKLWVILSFAALLAPLTMIMGSLVNLSYYLNFLMSVITSNGASIVVKPTSRTIQWPLVLLAWIACIPIPILFMMMLP